MFGGLVAVSQVIGCGLLLDSTMLGPAAGDVDNNGNSVAAASETSGAEVADNTTVATDAAVSDALNAPSADPIYSAKCGPDTTICVDFGPDTLANVLLEGDGSMADIVSDNGSGFAVHEVSASGPMLSIAKPATWGEGATAVEVVVHFRLDAWPPNTGDSRDDRRMLFDSNSSLASGIYADRNIQIMVPLYDPTAEYERRVVYISTPPMDQVGLQLGAWHAIRFTYAAGTVQGWFDGTPLELAPGAWNGSVDNVVYEDTLQIFNSVLRAGTTTRLRLGHDDQDPSEYDANAPLDVWEGALSYFSVTFTGP